MECPISPKNCVQQRTKRRIRLTISYDGTEFSGWQRQKHATTIQEEIEKHLSRMTNEDIFLHGAGRTDAGVHAESMVAHFDTFATINDTNFFLGLNSMLSKAIRIKEAKTCDPEFHARFSATGKKYQYHLHTGSIHPPHIRLYTLHTPHISQLQAMRACLQTLEGEHNFSSFENTGSRDKSITTGRGAVRTIYEAQLLTPKKNRLIFNFIGDGFLKNMVRNMVGTLLEVGRGKISPDEFKTIFLKKNRNSAGPTAPAHGLFLKKVYYRTSFKNKI